MWLWMSLISGVLLGFYEIFTKKALSKASLLNVLALYTLCSFLLVSFEIRNALNISFPYLCLIFLKSLIIFFSWLLGFLALRNIPISIYSPFTTLVPVFTVVLGVAVLGERLVFWQSFGVFLILIAYYFINKTGSKETGNLMFNKYFYLVVGSTFLSAISAMIDKIALKSINIGQMQFWFCFFLTLLYFGAWFFTGIKEHQKLTFKFNYFIVLMSIFLVVSDRIYFHAVNAVSSQIAIILPVRRSSVLVSAIAGGIIFREKNLRAKFWCVCLVIAGIVIVFVGK